MYSVEVLDHPPFQIHLEPDSPIELDGMLRLLAAVSRQFEQFAETEGLSTSKDAKLLVSSVKPGSIDIGLIPDLTTLGTLLAPALVYSTPVLKFMAALKGLIDKFKKKPDPASTTIRECTDAQNIGSAIAQAGGSQTFNTFNGSVYIPVIQMTAEEARKIVGNACETRKLLEAPQDDVSQRVPMVWHGLDNDAARTAGKRTPDRGIIEEIDPEPKRVFFEDEFAPLKREMLGSEENPYHKVHFVDVRVSRVGGKVVSYRVIGYHGSEDLPAG